MRQPRERRFPPLPVDLGADVAAARTAWADLAPTLDPARLVFLDEPFAGMSGEEARSLSKLLLDVRASTGMALVIVDHNVEVLVSVAERLIALAEGRVIAEGTATAVLSDPAVVRSYVGTDV